MHLTNSKRGSAIIIALIISVITISLAFFTIKTTRNILYSSQMLLDKLQAQLKAESTIEKLKFYASTGRFYQNYIENDTPNLGFPVRLYIDGRPQKIDNSTIIRLYDTGSKINVLSPYFGAVENFFTLEGYNSQKTSIIHDSLLDWYDKDNLKHLNGAEYYYYRFVKQAKYEPRNFAGVQSIYEWKLIKGLNDNLSFDKIKPHLTLTPKWMPNINTMDEKMLASFLGVSQDLSKELVNLRHSKGYLDILDIQRLTGKRIDPDIFSFFPTFSLDIKEKIHFNSANDKIRCSISFKQAKDKPYTILKWKE